MLMVATAESPQLALQRLIDEHREEYASLSRLIGRNAAYIQQFIKRGTPKQLNENDRRLLASYFGVSEALLGGPQNDPSSDWVPVPVLGVRASAGHGTHNDAEVNRGAVGFDPRWLRALTRGPTDGLSIIMISGESMTPTLADGDEVIVDRRDGVGRLRDGIYVLRLDDSLMIKRLARRPAGPGVSIRSDNPDYPSWQNVDPGRINIVGRVLWYGRKLA